ncbi:MAG TPA: DoxX family protein [Rhizomicrobium sp.]|nr:DoxX family protein [Rhizomicrobium sp.]
MDTIFAPSHFAWALSAAFGAAAAVHLLGLRAVREAYARWQYPRGFREVTGTLLALAAVFLAFPLTRLWGIAIAAFVMFLSATTLLHHRQYGYAAPIIALLFTLIPASLAGPV